MFRSLSSKVITIFICVTVLVVVVTSAVYISLFFRYAYEEKSNAILNSAETISNIITSADSLNEEVLKERSFPDYSGLVAGIMDSTLWVCKTDGFFVTMKNSGAPISWQQLTSEQRQIIKNGLGGSEVVTSSFSSFFGEETVSAVVPIFCADEFCLGTPEIIGVALVHAPIRYINQSVRESAFMLSLSFVAALIITAIVAVGFAIHLTKPVREMCAAASKLAQGEFDINIVTKDKTELQELAQTINRLAYNLGGAFTRLKNEKDKLNSIIDNISDGLASYDVNMHLQKYNMALLRLCNQGQLDDPTVTDMIMQVMQTGEKRSVVLNGKDILKITGTRIQNEDITEGVVIIVQDISQTERLNQLRTDFVANVSHEFRTPLTIIKGSVEALMDGAVESDDDKMAYYARIETESRALERLVRDLLDTSKYKAGKIILEVHPLDASWLISDLAEKLKPTAAEKGIRLIYKASDLPEVLADYDRLRQMIIVFLDNAIKFTPSGGSVTVSTEAKSDGYAYISIKDTGVGIAEDDIPYIFDRFYKADKARGGSETGTGLGLSIAWELAQLHKGTILVESELGSGTTFTIVIPLVGNIS